MLICQCHKSSKCVEFPYIYIFCCLFVVVDNGVIVGSGCLLRKKGLKKKKKQKKIVRKNSQEKVDELQKRGNKNPIPHRMTCGPSNAPFFFFFVVVVVHDQHQSIDQNQSTYFAILL